MGRHGGHPSLKRTLTLEGCGPSQPHKGQYWAHASLRQNEVSNIGCACLVAAKRSSRRSAGAEGPGALQVSIKAPLVLPDLEGCSPLQPRNLIKAQHWAHASLRQNEVPVVQLGAEGPGALQVSIKVPIVVF